LGRDRVATALELLECSTHDLVRREQAEIDRTGEERVIEVLVLPRHGVLEGPERREALRAELLQCRQRLTPVGRPTERVQATEVRRGLGTHLGHRLRRRLGGHCGRDGWNSRPLRQSAPILVVEIPDAAERRIARAGLHQPPPRRANAAVPELHAQLLPSAREGVPLLARGQPELVRDEHELHADASRPGSQPLGELRSARLHRRQPS